MSQLGLILQESVRREREARTILVLLAEQMDGVYRGGTRRRSLKERLGFRGIGCCGVSWGFRPTPLGVSHEEETERVDESNPGQIQTSVHLDPGSDVPTRSSHSGMNLAAALAAERPFRVSDDGNGPNGAASGNPEMPGTPSRVSLMRLLEETDVEGYREGGTLDNGVPYGTETERGGGGGAGYDTVCCVCMVRKKGAAYIPCGHTYCRLCSREMWLNRGACPLCNRLIVEILDIF